MLYSGRGIPFLTRTQIQRALMELIFLRQRRTRFYRILSARIHRIALWAYPAAFDDRSMFYPNQVYTIFIRYYKDCAHENISSMSCFAKWLLPKKMEYIPPSQRLIIWVEMERALTYDRVWFAQESKLKERDLIDSVLNGDNDAFKEIVEKYESRVAATVIGMLGHCPEAEDIGQETFVRLYQSLRKFRGESSLGTYITRIAINLSLNEIRRRGRHRQFYLTDSAEKIEKLADSENPSKQNEMSDLIQRGLQKLPAKFRSVIVLRLIDGYSTEETAKILDLPAGTVLSRLSRAQMKLKIILAPLYKGELDG